MVSATSRLWSIHDATSIDLVFNACYEQIDPESALAAAPAGIHPDIRRDRLYQTAAAWFNLGRFDEAEKRFRMIEADPSWPGGLWAPYMIGRSILWQDTEGMRRR